MGLNEWISVLSGAAGFFLGWLLKHSALKKINDKATNSAMLKVEKIDSLTKDSKDPLVYAADLLYDEPENPDLNGKPYDGSPGKLLFSATKRGRKEYCRPIKGQVLVKRYELKNGGTGTALDVKLSGAGIIGNTKIKSLKPSSSVIVGLVFPASPEEADPYFEHGKLVISYATSNGKEKQVERTVYA